LPQPASAAAIAKAAIALIPRLLFFKTLYLDPALPDFDPAIPDFPFPSGHNRLPGGSPPHATAAGEMTGNQVMGKSGIALKERN
jgi:hypothetical protein